MIYLTAVTDKLQIVTTTAATIDVQANYIDAVLTTGVFSGAGRQNTASSSATTTDVLAAPAGSTLRTLKQLTARNKDASLACDVTFVYDANGTDNEMEKFTLQPGECVIYIEGVGFFLRSATTALLNKVIIMAADSTHATAATFADITGLTCPLLSGKKYAIDAVLFHTNNASTTGSQFGYNIGNAPTLAIFGNNSAVTNSVTAGALSIGTATARDTAITAQTTGQTATGISYVSGMIQPSADGTFAMRATSEVTVGSGLIVKAGSYMRVTQER